MYADGEIIFIVFADDTRKNIIYWLRHQIVH